MTSRVAFLFPGQGSYLPGAFAGIGADADRISARVAEIDAVTAEYQLKPVQPLLFSPDAPTLGKLLDAEPERLDVAILATSLALATLLEDRYGITPDHVIGHSHGEVAALAAAGVLTPADAVRAVCERYAALRKAPPPSGGMLAVNTDPAGAEKLLASVHADASAVSAHNSPHQTVISGPDADLAKLQEAAREARIRTSRLHVPGLFHVPQLAEAGALYATAMGDIPMSAPREGFFYSQSLGRHLTADDDVIGLLVSDMTEPVRFDDAVRALHAEGVTTFVECGALDVLTRIVSGFLPSVVTVAPLREPMATGDLSARLGPLAAPDAAPSVEQTPSGNAPDEAEAPEADPEILEDVRALCAEMLEYPADVVTDDADFQADLGVDSLTMTELLDRVLQQYGLGDKFHDANAEIHATVAELAAYVTGLRREQQR
ncbi:acyltransferase domain-containing protein [Streptomyces sp. NPDC051214]|uniref:acyltransferase domain-containing protein n=1 Tax=Streptomyces sp. NPDC051214 TaxID=3155282 RepID=UPI003435A757